MLSLVPPGVVGVVGVEFWALATGGAATVAAPIANFKPLQEQIELVCFEILS